MLSIEEKKNLRIEFWSKFKAYSNNRKLKAGKSGKWITDKTGIKQLKLKFHIDEEHAWAGIEIDSRNLDKRIDLFDKLEKLKTILTNAVPFDLKWELEEKITDKKSVSRIYAQLNNVSIYNKAIWKEASNFLYRVMDPIEDIFREYFDFLKYQ